jgi:hypothetical protein
MRQPVVRGTIAFTVVVLLMAAAGVDHYFRDEFYYLACARHMAWGYVDQPPLSIAVLWLVRQVAGDSLIVLRFVAALALAATVRLTGGIARQLGAASYGQGLAMLGVATAPVFLAYGSFYSMNVFDLLLWTAAVRAFMAALERPRPTAWAVTGLILGLGLMNKISVLWLGAGIAAALLLTPARRQLTTRGPYLAAAIAAIIFLPHVVWQIAHGWPTLEFMRNAASEKMQHNTPLSFMVDQVMNLNPMTLPLWGTGLIALMASRRLRAFRALAIVWITVALILIANRTSRSGYLLPAYPALFAAGAATIERALSGRAARATVVTVLLLGGAVAVPLAVPILPTDAYVRYSRALGMAPSTEEKQDLGRLPQFYADRQGWDSLVGAVAAAWDGLSADERADAAVLTGNYGEAGAIEHLGRARGLVAVSGHNNYWLWGPQGRGTKTLIVLSRHPERLRTWWADVQRAGETACGDCMPYENHLPIWVCRRPIVPLASRWPDLKHYE